MQIQAKQKREQSQVQTKQKQGKRSNSRNRGRNKRSTKRHSNRRRDKNRDRSVSGADEAIAVQKLSLGAKESDIVLPDTLEVRMKQETSEDAPKAEGKLQIDAEADDEKERSETEADENISRIFGVTWKLDIGESDYPEFHGGISPQDYFEEFDEDGEPIETSYKTWAGYHEANQDYNGSAYVYTPVLAGGIFTGRGGRASGNLRSRRRDAADDSGRRGI